MDAHLERPDGELTRPQSLRMDTGAVPLVAVVWALTATGGAACGVVFGVFMPDLAGVTIPIGLFLGLVIGLPVGLLLTVVIRRPRDRAEIAALGRGLEALGMSLALFFTLPWIAYLALAGSRLLDPPAVRSIVLLPLGKGMVALVATALIGRVLGWCLARLVYGGYRLADRPRCSVLFR